MKEENKEVELYPSSLMEDTDVEYIEILLKRYHKGIRILFNKYSSSMYSVKSTHKFEDNMGRK